MAGNMNNLHAFRFTADGTAGPFDFVCTRGWRVLDLMANTDATVGAATLQLQRSTAAAPTVFNVTSAALAADTIDDIEYNTSLIAAEATYAVGDTMRVVSVNLAQAELIIEVLPTTWIPG